ncbi:hypothetical protein T11_12599 [Trichinella zimbabwensis]|uniref:Uncharacterized protein n=1 Tax=Trichinella zimbabwensis TaxID=268475 RepID=A0A0V1FD84_9BILA|nr:hypothetical protein T11_12599 [Trichinella zimbabwensis]
MLLENSRKREKEGEDSLAENFSVLDKKRRSCSKENSSGTDKKRAQLLLLGQNSGKREKD